jgi:hypothetical protein
MPVNPDDFTFQAWQNLVKIIRGECNVGPTGPGTGQNVTGRLQLVYDVRASNHLSSGLYPAIGVQLRKAPRTIAATNRIDITCNFEIVIAVQKQQKQDPITKNVIPPTLDDAMNALQTVLSDGTGNGLLQVLYDKKYWGLPPTDGLGTVTGAPVGYRNYIGDVEYDSLVKPGDTTVIYAYAYVPFYVIIRSSIY